MNAPQPAVIFVLPPSEAGAPGWDRRQARRPQPHPQPSAQTAGLASAADSVAARGRFEI
jgi:hypothetical protein